MTKYGRERKWLLRRVRRGVIRQSEVREWLRRVRSDPRGSHWLHEHVGIIENYPSGHRNSPDYLQKFPKDQPQ